PLPPATRNPFSLPSDEEVFRLRDEERRSRLAAKDKNKSLKVWQKGGSTKGRSLRMKDLKGEEAAEGGEGKKAAAGVVQERRQEKEIMTEFIAKKREMFLVQMSLDTKREEIRKLEEKAQMKEEALLKSEQMLEEDAIRFDTFLKENDKKAHEAIKKAEKETKLKTDKVQEIKKLNQQIQMVQSDMSKHKEALEDCLKYKEFLDRLTPPEWFEERAADKRARQEDRRNQRIGARKAKWDIEKKRIYQEAVARHEAEQAAAGGDKGKGGGRSRRRRTEGVEPALQVQYPPAPNFDGEPYTSSGSEMPMYFTDPQQLLDVFTALEEQNLFLIQNSQETEQALDDLKATYKDTTKRMDEKTRSLEENIGTLKGQIGVEEQKANQLKRRVKQSAGDTQDKQEVLLQSLGEKVKNVYQRCGFDSSSNPSTLFMLSDLEAKLEDLLNALELMPEEYVKRVEKEKEKKRRELKRAEQQAAQEQAQEERNRKAIERSLQPARKRTGRQVMHRSQQVRRKAKEQAAEATEDDMDEIKHLT
ncbi:hypothetical protein TeGR_g8579, partial [Tetraparma gracilis]